MVRVKISCLAEAGWFMFIIKLAVFFCKDLDLEL